jgi:hypothetical protein
MKKPASPWNYGKSEHKECDLSQEALDDKDAKDLGDQDGAQDAVRLAR